VAFRSIFRVLTSILPELDRVFSLLLPFFVGFCPRLQEVACARTSSRILPIPQERTFFPLAVEIVSYQCPLLLRLDGHLSVSGIQRLARVRGPVVVFPCCLSLFFSWTTVMR